MTIATPMRLNGTGCLCISFFKGCSKRKEEIFIKWRICSSDLAVLWNGNRNRSNRNLFNCRNRNVVNYGSGTGTRYKIKYLISFIKNFFHSHFTINLMKLKNIFLVKRQDFFRKFFLNICFLWSRFGAGNGTVTVTCQKSEPEPEL
jgi:hypothetical protein